MLVIDEELEILDIELVDGLDVILAMVDELGEPLRLGVIVHLPD